MAEKAKADTPKAEKPKAEKPAAPKAKVPKTAEKAKTADAKTVSAPPRLKVKYNQEIASALMKKFSYKSPMQTPKLEKIVVNVGCGEARDNTKMMEAIINDLGVITGQKAVVTNAKKSIANFKLREGMPVGAKVTLRGARMWEFLDRLFNIALPRVRDFRGINPNGFDGRGNYALGLREQLVFPEINYDKIDKIRGMNIVFTTTAQTDEEAKELLSLLGAPFVRT